jgi:hypothetical protein
VVTHCLALKALKAKLMGRTVVSVEDAACHYTAVKCSVATAGKLTE